MRPTHLVDDTKRHTAAASHSDAAPRVKRYAALLGVTARTARRHRSPDEAKGSPLYRFNEYLEAVDDPWRILATNMATVKQRILSQWTDAEIVQRIETLHAEDALQEGIDNANRARRGLTWLDRATDTERDAAHDIALTALYREAHIRGISESEVFGS